MFKKSGILESRVGIDEQFAKQKKEYLMEDPPINEVGEEEEAKKSSPVQSQNISIPKENTNTIEDDPVIQEVYNNLI